VAKDAGEALEQEILTRLERTKRKHFHLDKLASALGRSHDEIEQAVERLAERGEVVRARKGRIALAARLGLVTGTMNIGRRGKAVVIADDGDVPISLPRAGVRPAMHGDRVLVEVQPYRRRGLRSGTIAKIVERKTVSLVGSVEDAGEHFGPVFVPAGRHAGYVGTLHGEGISARPGDVVAGSIVEYPTTRRGPIVRAERVLGRAGTLPAEIEATCHTMGIPSRFPAAVENAAKGFEEPDAETLAGRRDLRSTLAMTIDPVDARDYDDAVSIERADGGFRLTVSIADVSHYVRPGSPIDAEALERGTSVYFPGRCVPMLPESLSSSLASLLPDVDRLAVSVFLAIDSKGEVAGADFARTVIRSRARLTYERAQAIVDGQEREDPGLSDALAAMAACAKLLHERRMARGAIDLDVPEAVVTVDEHGHPTAIARHGRLLAHRIIEEFMLAANEAMARRLESARVGFLYRIHERPDAEAVATLAARLSVLGLRLPGDGARIAPAAFQKVVEQASGKPHERLVNLLVLRTMTRARYSAYKEIHFGLASDCYTHFTSPIRRYPDLLAHRALCAVLESRATRLPPAEALEPIAEQSSDRERRAMEAERDVDRAAAILFMQDHIGREFAGSVTGVDRYGFWVELDEAFVEGFVPVARLEEYYDFISERMELQSRTSRHALRIGDRIRVRVVAADLADRRLEFEPVRVP
jgi:ribonuclease R